MKLKTLHFKTITLSLSQFHTFISLLLLGRHLLYSVSNCNPFYSLLISFFFNHLLQSSQVSIHEHNIIFFNRRFQYFLGIFFDFVLCPIIVIFCYVIVIYCYSLMTECFLRYLVSWNLCFRHCKIILNRDSLWTCGSNKTIKWVRYS